MSIQYILSLCLLAVLVIMVRVRATILSRRGIRVMVFGKTDKSDFLLVFLILAILYTAFANILGLPMPGLLIHPFWSSPAPGWIGILLCVLAVVGFALAIKGFGDSFRVGIDEESPDKLVTGGIFALSRNPIYVCFLLFFAGMFLIHRNIVILAADILFALAVHRQILREEKFLEQHYGEEYERYKNKVRRYL